MSRRPVLEPHRRVVPGSGHWCHLEAGFQAPQEALRHRTRGMIRHYVATQLLAAGVDVRTVAGRPEHRNASTTLNVYSHFLEDAECPCFGVRCDLPTKGIGHPVSSFLGHDRRVQARRGRRSRCRAYALHRRPAYSMFASRCTCPEKPLPAGPSGFAARRAGDRPWVRRALCASRFSAAGRRRLGVRPAPDVRLVSRHRCGR